MLLNNIVKVSYGVAKVGVATHKVFTPVLIKGVESTTRFAKKEYVEARKEVTRQNVLIAKDYEVARKKVSASIDSFMEEFNKKLELA